MSRFPPKIAPTSLDVYYRSVAAAAMGTDPSKLLFWWHPFWALGESGLQISLAGTGVRTGVQKALRCSSGGGAGGAISFLIASNTPSRDPFQVLAGAGQKWWMGYYGAVNASGTTSIPATGTIGIGTNTGAGDSMLVGARGATSTTNFVAWSTNAAIDSGLTLDTTKRTHQVWRDGTTGWYQIDSRAPVSGDLRPAADSMGTIDIFDSAANTQFADLVWWAFATPAP